MEVKEIFELRKQGRVEEAYELIRPMYAAHKGKYTTLCVFWTASDILKKRVKEEQHDEAVKIFKAQSPDSSCRPADTLLCLPGT